MCLFSQFCRSTFQASDRFAIPWMTYRWFAKAMDQWYFSSKTSPTSCVQPQKPISRIEGNTVYSPFVVSCQDVLYYVIIHKFLIIAQIYTLNSRIFTHRTRIISIPLSAIYRVWYFPTDERVGLNNMQPPERFCLAQGQSAQLHPGPWKIIS